MMYRFFKLINGDNILATVPEEDYTTSTETIILQDPVILNVVRYLRAGALVEAYVFSNWFNGITTDTVNIHASNIVASAEARESIIEQYKLFLQQTNNSDQSIFDEEDMVENEIDDISNEDEDTNSEPSRTIH